MFGGMLGAVGMLARHWSVHKLDLRPPRPPCMNGGGIPGMPAFCQLLSSSLQSIELTWRWEPTGHWHSHRPSHAHWRTHRSSPKLSTQVRGIQRVRLAFRTVRVRDTINNLLCLLTGNLLVVGLDVAQVVATAVVRLAHAHTVVCKVHIAVVTEELWHCCDSIPGNNIMREIVLRECARDWCSASRASRWRWSRARETEASALQNADASLGKAARCT